MSKIVDAVKKIIVNFLVSQVLTKENVEKWIDERLNEAVEKANATPDVTDDVIVNKIKEIWEAIKNG